MAKYNVYGKIVATKFIGTFEAESEEEAEQMAWKSDEAYPSLCWQCSREIEEPEVDEMIVEIEEGNVVINQIE